MDKTLIISAILLFVHLELFLGIDHINGQQYHDSIYSSFNEYYNSENYQKAIKIIHQESDHFNNDSIPTSLLINLGKCYSEVGEQDTAIYYFQIALDRLEPSNIELREYLYQNLGLANTRIRNFTEARNWLKAASNINDTNNIQSLISLNRYWGNFLLNIKQYDSAIIFLNRGLEHCTINEERIKFYILFATIYKKIGEFSKSEKYEEYSLQLIDSVDPRKLCNLSLILNNLAVTNFKLGKYNKAVQIYMIAIKKSQECSYHDIRNVIFENLALTYSKKGKRDSAEKYFKLSFELSDKLNFVDLVGLYQNYGNFLMVHKKNLPGSYSYYNRAAQLIQDQFHPFHPRLKNIYVCIGDVYWRMHKMDSALYMYQKALKTIDTTLSLEEYAGSPDFRQAADLESLNIIMRKIRVLEILLVDQEDKDLGKQYYEALLTNVDYYKDAFASLLARKILLADQINSLKGDLKNMMDIGIEAAHKLYEVNHETFYLEKALAWSEAARSLILKTNFYSLYHADSNRAKLLRKAGKLKKRINALYFQLDDGPQMDSLNALIFSLNFRYDSLSQVLASQLPEFLKINRIRPYDANALIREIPDSTLILEYFLYRDRLHIFKMSGEGLEWYRLAFGDSLRKQVQEFTDFLKPENAHTETYRNAYFENALSLRKAIIPGKISSRVSNLVIIPDGILYYFPFEIMHTHKTQSRAFRKMPYLLREYNISYRYTLDTLENKIKREKARILAVAPQISSFYRDDGKLMGPIAEARAEADTLIKLYRGKLYSPNSEKEFARMAGKYQILHFATHGIIDDRMPMNSQLLLNKSHDEINKLKLAEICNLDLQAEMAVLSACETGKGNILNGEGVLSLAWAFKYAGCPSVLMSLYLLDDHSAKMLMIRLYGYLDEGYRKDKALRKAKLDFIEEAPPFKIHPAYWAGLISTGDQSKVLLEKNRNVSIHLLWIGLGPIILLGIFWLRRRRNKRY